MDIFLLHFIGRESMEDGGTEMGMFANIVNNLYVTRSLTICTHGNPSVLMNFGVLV